MVVIEKGRTVRVDSTAVKTDIHHPTDSTLLSDSVRIITRWLAEGKELGPQPAYQFSDHQRGVKKRVMTILNARKDETRYGRRPTGSSFIYVGLVKGYAESAIPELTDYEGHTLEDTFTGRELPRHQLREVSGEAGAPAKRVGGFAEEGVLNPINCSEVSGEAPRLCRGGGAEPH